MSKKRQKQHLRYIDGKKKGAPKKSTFSSKMHKHLNNNKTYLELCVIIVSCMVIITLFTLKVFTYELSFANVSGGTATYTFVSTNLRILCKALTGIGS